MARHVCWDPSRVRDLFTTEASTKSLADGFAEVHLPLDHVRVLDAKPGIFPAGVLREERGGTFTSEGGVLRALTGSRLTDPNRIFVIVGEPGAGKSHLARWLELQLERQPGYFPIHIPRHVDSLSAVVRRLAERTGVGEGFAEMGRVIETPPDKLVRYLLAAIELELGRGTVEGERSPDLARVVESPAFRLLVEHQVARYQSERTQRDHGLKTREILALGREDFQALLDALGVRAQPVEVDRWLGRLSGTIREALLRATGLGGLDVKELLAEISRKTVEKGVRPVLILEDVTSFDMLHDDLMMFLLDESAGHYDAVVCWTTGFERNYMQTYQEQRYAARLSLTDEQGEAYSLKDGGAVELVRRYLDAVRIGDGACPYCARMPSFEGLYPFNRVCIERIHENLVTTDREQRRTPRHLLDRAVKAYLELAESDGPFPPSRQPASVRDVVVDTSLFGYREEYPGFVSLVSWYGREEEGALAVDRSIARGLGVALPEELDEDEVIRVERRGVAAAADTEIRVVAEQVEAENRFKALRLELQSWFHYQMPIDHYMELQRGVNRLLGFFRGRLPLQFVHEGGALGAGRPIVYGRDAGETNIFVVGNRGVPPRFLAFDVGPGTQPFSAKEQYLALETGLALNVLGGFPEGSDFALLEEWAETALADYRRAVRERLAEQLGAPPEEVLLFAKFLLLNRFAGVADPGAVPAVRYVARLDLPPGLAGDRYGDLAAHVDRIDGALRALFFTSHDVLDHPRLEGAVSRLDGDRLLRAVAGVAVTRIDEEAKFADGSRLADLSRAVKALSQAIQGGSLAEEASTLRARVSRLDAIVRDTDLAALGPALDGLLQRVAMSRGKLVLDGAMLRQWMTAERDLAGLAKDPAWRHDVAAALRDSDRPFAQVAGLALANAVLDRDAARALEAVDALLGSLDDQAASLEASSEVGTFTATLRRVDELRNGLKVLEPVR